MTNDELRASALKSLHSVATTALDPEHQISAAQALLWAIREDDVTATVDQTDYEELRGSVSDALYAKIWAEGPGALFTSYSPDITIRILTDAVLDALRGRTR